jgi:hypothetical protein
MSQTSLIPVTPGQRYTATVWLKTSAGSGNLTLTFFQEGSYTGAAYTSADASGDWTQVSVSGTAPAGATSVRLEFRYYGPGSLWADDIALQQS